MAFALLFLGLLPLVFMVDIGPEGEDSVDAEGDVSDDAGFGSTAAMCISFFADELDTADDNGEPAAQSGLTTANLALEPITDDEDPFEANHIDPGDVLKPETGDEEPTEPDPVDPEQVLDPVTDPGDDAPADSDATLLQSLLGSQTGFDDGAGWLGDYGPETDDVSLTADENHTEDDDGEADTGQGRLAAFEGTPVVQSDDPVRVIHGGDGANEITLGDAAAYAFGGDGDDTITAGEGASALFGGAGADTLVTSNTDGWADGGAGNDTILGGDGDDTLHGGAHSDGDQAVQDDDTIDGGDGDDEISGGYGADTLAGGDGDDVIDHLGRVEEDLSTPGDRFAFHIDGDADTLDGGAGNDTLIMDGGDAASGGAGFDTFWVYFDGASGSGPAEIDDFTLGEDFLRITLNPELNHGDMTLTVEPSDNGQDGLVSVNGDLVAVLVGTPGATSADVMVEVGANTFG